MGGSNKHCIHGNCNSDSRIGRPGYDPNTRFFRFPKPCISFRRSGISKYLGYISLDSSVTLPKNYVTEHIRHCQECDLCHKWMLRCKRGDYKFASIADITENTFICSKHFPDNTLVIDYAVHLPGETKNKKKRLLRERYSGPSSRQSVLQENFEDNEGEEFDGADPGEDEEMVFVNQDDIVVDGLVTCDQELFIDGFVTCDQEIQASTTVRSCSTQTDFLFDLHTLSETNKKLKIKICKLGKKNRELTVTMNNLREEIKTSKREEVADFQNSIEQSESMSLFYLGFTFNMLLTILKFLGVEKVDKYWGKHTSSSDRRSTKILTPLQELIITLLRLRSGLLLEDIGFRFNLSVALVSRTVTTWIQLMYCKFNDLRPYMFPSREKIAETLPKRFSQLKNIRAIIDCAEIFCETPQDFAQQSNVYSNYKAHATFKVLLGCTPNGAVSFVSDLFEGSISDRELVMKSGIMELLNENDLLLADRGFTIKDLTDEKHVQLNIPAFLKGRERLTPEEEIATRNIAKTRIFVEHVVRRLKEFRIYQRIVPQNLRHILSQSVFVCACLLNFRKPLIMD